MIEKDVDKHFVSDIDKYLEQLRKRESSSKSQQKEYQEYKQLYQLRDNPKGS